jgi:hypothetical protein
MTFEPAVLNRRDFPGRLPPRTKLVDRTTLLGNPFHIGPDGSRDEVIAKYEAYVRSRPELMALIRELRGWNLMCWCAPLPCHAEVILRLANEN